MIGQVVTKEYNLYGPMLGLGIPQRTPSYILGRPIWKDIYHDPKRIKWFSF